MKILLACTDTELVGGLTFWLWMSAFGLILVLVFSATLNLSLRLPSRARMEEALRKLGREEQLQRLYSERVELQLATAVLRTSSLLGVVLVLLKLASRWGIQSGVWMNALVFGLSLLVVLVFGVAIPIAWSKYAGEPLLVKMLPMLHVLRVCLKPLIGLLGVFDELVRRLSGVPKEDASSQAYQLEQELLQIVSEGEARGAVDEEEADMIESIIDLRDTAVDEIMTPRTDIEALEKNVTFEEVRAFIQEKGHSRIPVYDETIDQVLGILYAKDLLKLDDPDLFDASSLMRSALYIPESKLLRDLLHEFREKKVHMAIVLDEYGGTAGLVTIEDILEELVGDIVDEYEQEEQPPLLRIDPSTVEVDARMRIGDINDELEIALPEDEDYETIGGFVCSMLGKIPAAGETCVHDNVRIHVMSAEPRRVNRLQLYIEPVENGQNGSRGNHQG